ncbi:hypothetical protein [Prosthecobacter sp.]|uniref:hypothetical protein n=1 Tax=Prosthecobacter sp. TaxID=1965333 RepID=UPI001D4EA6BE|nr:hypothetical protein [Prosthecobacter sp.]MCB1275970.1 hypothetical protein [Prosthecobacter sp.]
MSSTLVQKTSTIAAVLALTFGSLSAQTTPSDPELKTLLFAYKARVSKDVETPLSKTQDELNQNYIKALDRLQQETTIKGKLGEASAIKAEKEAVAASGHQDLPILPTGLRELPPLRRKYLEAMQTLRTGMQRKLEPLQRELVRQLDALAIKMAHAGKSDAALEARQLARAYSENTGALEGDWEDHTQKVTPKPRGSPIVIKRRDILTTEASFKPPVEIELVAKIEDLDLRLGYAADQLIFNWERKPDELRIDGGPASKIYTPMQGEIPKDKFVVIRWTITKEKQTISVDGKQRFEHEGDYSGIDRPFSVQAFGSDATVQSIKVRRPPSP